MRHHPAALLLPVTMYMATPTLAAPNVSVSVNPANTVPGVVANSIFTDGDGIDWTGAGFYLELDQGQVYNAPDFDSAAVQSGFWPFLPELEFDSWVGIPNGNSLGINGRAGELSGIGGGSHVGLTGPGNQTIDVAWFNTSLTDTGLNQIANISLSDDAQGTWSVLVTFAFMPNRVYLSSPVVDGQLVWDPLQGDLGLDGFVGIADLNTVLGQWNQSVPSGNAADPSGDGFVGIDDLNTVLGNWNAGLVPLIPGSFTGVLERDLDRDGYVGLSDQNILQSNWNMNVPPGDPRADPSGDGFVGIDDKVNGNWGAGTPPQPLPGATPPAVTPEPSTGCVTVILGITLIRRRA